MLKFYTLFFCLLLVACSNVSITDRKQLIILGDKTIYPQAFKAYQDFKDKNKLIETGKDISNIEEVTENIKIAIKKYYQSINKPDPTSNFVWEVILVDYKDIKNAWCMPGGKLAIYSGILEIAANQDALASLIGHEIAHAVARHSSERASQEVLLELGTVAIENLLIGKPLSEDNRKLYQYFTNFGVILPFSRTHEREADYLGLVFMHLAGYKMEEAYRMWQKMQKTIKKRTPEFLSTHPSSERRIANIKKWIPEIREKYNDY